MSLSSQNSAGQKTVFLDRDGVINQDSPAYIKNWSEFRFLPRSLAALKRLTRHHFRSYLITNQSAVNRNMITPETLARIHTRMRARIVGAGGRIDDIFFCPHRPEEGCNCRKPKPGLIHAAQKKYRIHLANSCMIGDSAKDIVCARRAGCGFAILVKTGKYSAAVRELSSAGYHPDYIAFDLYEAVDWIVGHSTR